MILALLWLSSTVKDLIQVMKSSGGSALPAVHELLFRQHIPPVAEQALALRLGRRSRKCDFASLSQAHSVWHVETESPGPVARNAGGHECHFAGTNGAKRRSRT